MAWQVIEVLWTPQAVQDGAITHLTTDAQIQSALANGYVTEIRLPIVFNCSAVPATTYWRGTPVA